ncbi:MAG: hypothetical protein NTW76_12280 [Corynebacteriales bacterium]|uniref:TY-Chap C-terminal domain-containing protein n=1 Tax=Williamsia herbipolensis TaxID=1603258 RepID=A0AAU4K6X9_9NOCA|nr:hypothetical protein [Williamsia herbipolensis]MCX6470075.1 hypothetical protein [Mycobacteriales bacterium]
MASRRTGTPRTGTRGISDELEQLLTLSRAQIDRALTDDGARDGLIELSLDEDLELREAAAAALDRGDDEHARAYEQEASAWRHTARLLRGETGSDRSARSRTA